VGKLAQPVHHLAVATASSAKCALTNVSRAAVLSQPHQNLQLPVPGDLLKQHGT
jgi:hypothetical protein